MRSAKQNRAFPGSRTLYVLALCFSFSAVFAQRYPFYNLSVESGLIQSQAQAIKQDKYGHLWIGTLGGLSRFDGKNFVNYTLRDGMADNSVNALDIDQQGNIWVGTSKGISKFDGKTFKHSSFQAAENNPLANNVQDIQIGSNGTIWCNVGGNGKNKIYGITNGKNVQLKVPGQDTAILSVLPDDKGLWLAKINGELLHYHAGAWDTISLPVSALINKVPILTKIYKGRNDTLWLLTNAGLYRLENGKAVLHSIKGQPLDKLPVLRCMTEDKNGAYWLGTNTGVIKLTGNSIEYYNKHNGLSDNIFRDVLTDAEGNVWMASDGQGLYRFSGSPFTILDETLGLPSAQIMSIAADRSGKLYFGTYDAGLYSFENGIVGKVPFPGKPGIAITALRYKDNKLWIGTRNGLWTYDNTFHFYTFPTDQLFSVSALYSDTSRKLWIGFGNGFAVYEHDSFHTVPLQGAVIGDFITIGADSTLVATTSSTYNGIKLYHDGVLTPYKTNGAPDSAQVQCFTKRGNELWIGTSDNGLICYNMSTKKYFVLNKSNGLRSDFIYNIITDNDGNIWTGTGYGIHKVTIGSDGKPMVTFYGKEEGMKGMESNHNAIYKMRDGSIWFGTTNGAMHYQPSIKTTQSKPVSIVLQSVKVFGENISDTAWYDSTNAWYKVPYGLHLPYKKNNITFAYQAISLGSDEQLLYRYRMEGLEAPWSDWSESNSVTYSALPPGLYTLKVQCKTMSTNADASELDYSFEIITPFQKTKWFNLIILGSCILLGVSMQYIANTRKQNRIKLLDKLRREEQGKVRQRTAEDFHDEVGNKLTRINVLANVLKNKIQLTPDTKRILDQIQDNTGQLYSGTKDILWSLKPSNDNLYQILLRINDFGAELFQDTEVDFNFIGTDEKWKEHSLPMDFSRNLIMIFKEALNNSLKYSKATEVKLEVSLQNHDILHLLLTDNGQGFDIDHAKKGHGIDNMNVRAKRINGRLYIESHPGKGTTISLGFKIPPKSAYGLGSTNI